MDIERKLNQVMTVYRASTTKFSGSGGAIVSQPVLVKCRWSTTSEKFVTNNGDEVYVKAWISAIEELSEGDLVVLGDTTTELDPSAVNAQELKRDSAIPNLSGDRTLFIYFV